MLRLNTKGVIMKINKNKRVSLIIGACGALVLVIGLMFYFTSVCHMRSVIKNGCGAGMDCKCFSNVVDNRLNDEQVRAFYHFIKSVKTRPTTNILEYTDEISARNISNAIVICRPQIQEQPKSKGKK